MFPLFAKLEDRNLKDLFIIGVRNEHKVIDNKMIIDLYKNSIIKKYNIDELNVEINNIIKKLGKENNKINELIKNDQMLNQIIKMNPLSLVMISNLVAIVYTENIGQNKVIELLIPNYTKDSLEKLVKELNRQDKLDDETEELIERTIESRGNMSKKIIKMIILNQIIKSNNFNRLLSEDEMEKLIKETLSKNVETFIDMNDNNKIGIVILLGLIMIILWMKLNRMGQSFTLSNLSKLV